jgi:hypothetical protein
MRLFTDFLKACLRLEIGWMEFLFLPAMTKLTLVAFRTSIEVGSYILGRFPVRANLRLVSEKIRLSPKVLPIMSVKANDSIMIIFFVRAPDSLEVIDVKIKVNDIVLNEIYRDLFPGVGKRTVLFVLTLLFPDEVRRTELGLVFIRVVELFNSIVCFVARILHRTGLVLIYELTLLRLVSAERPTLIIFELVVIGTCF